MLAFPESEFEEIEYDQSDENEECLSFQGATSVTGMPGKWFSAVVVTGVLRAQPANLDYSFTEHPTVHHISCHDEFDPTVSTSTCADVWTREPTTEILSEKDRLLDVRHFFTLSTTELATILGVSRQTVYAWLQGGADIRATNLTRLNLIHNLAQECRTQLGKPLQRSMVRADIEGKSMLSILSEETIDFQLAKTHFGKLVARALSERLATETISESARVLGFKPMPEWMQSDSIAEATDRVSNEG